MKSESTPILMGICAIGLSIASIIAAIRMRPDLAPNWLVGSFQFFMLVGGIIVLFGLGSFVFWLYNSAFERLAKLEESHSAILEKLRRKRPPWIVATIYIAEVYLVFADKVFGDDVGTTVAATLILIGWFHVANHFVQSDDSNTRKWIGIPLWLVGVVFLPVSAVAYRGSLAESWNTLGTLPWYTLIIIVLGLVYIVWIPFGIGQDNIDEPTQ